MLRGLGCLFKERMLRQIAESSRSAIAASRAVSQEAVDEFLQAHHFLTPATAATAIGATTAAATCATTATIAATTTVTAAADAPIAFLSVAAAAGVQPAQLDGDEASTKSCAKPAKVGPLARRLRESAWHARGHRSR